MRRMKRCAALALALSLLPVAGSAQTALPVVTMAGPANDTSATFLYAADMGFFTKAGLDVRINVQSNPGTVTAAVASGALDAGSITVPTVALAYDHNIPLRMIAPAGIYSSDTPTSGLVVLKNSPIHQAADLSGKTIGVRDINNMNYYAAKVWIDRHGGTSGRDSREPDARSARVRPHRCCRNGEPRLLRCGARHRRTPPRADV
jgi:ABC-type nitrate/sulfonate/bicarbonate transport system substrate-binding protein